MGRSLRRFKPLEYAVGTDGTIVIALKDENGDPLGVVGASAEWKLFENVPRNRRKPYRGFAKLTKSTTAGTIALITGQATVTIGSGDFENISGPHWQVLRITDSSGNITNLGQGQVLLRAAAA